MAQDFVFKTGKKYRNYNWSFTVLKINGGTLTVKTEHGKITNLDTKQAYKNIYIACPICRGKMIVSVVNGRNMYRCSSYPKCVGIRRIKTLPIKRQSKKLLKVKASKSTQNKAIPIKSISKKPSGHMSPPVAKQVERAGCPICRGSGKINGSICTNCMGRGWTHPPEFDYFR